MCGIAGYLRKNQDSPTSLQTALQILAHRGPDDSGTQLLRSSSGWHFGLAHRRLSILDLSPAGHQPLKYERENRELWTVFNGEIYNYLELRRELEGQGHRFKTKTDTEVALAAFWQWGEGAFTRFRGMFAMAIADPSQNRLWLARDPMGIKPLFYSGGSGSHEFGFASEVSPLLEWNPKLRVLNSERAVEYLARGWVDYGNQTFYQDLLQVRPGHFLEISLEGEKPKLRERGYSRPWRDSPQRRERLTDADAVQEIRQAFLESMKLHLRSDVPVGMALSGGIDSSSIAMAARRIAGSAQEIHAFSYLSENPAQNEERWIELVAKEAGMKLHRVRVQPKQLARDWEKLLDAQGEPFQTLGMYAQFRVFQEAKTQGVKVLLDGQGADEIFAGYPGYFSRRFFARRQVDRLKRGVKKFLPASRYLSSLAVRQIDFPKEPGTLDEMLGDTLERTSLPALLRYEDRNSMAFSVESRVPFLDPELIRLASRLSPDQWIGRDGTTKRVFREAMRGIVPDAILNRKDKIGFSVPDFDWMVHPDGLRERISDELRSDHFSKIPWVNSGRIQKDWEKTLNGEPRLTFPLWRAFCLSAWMQTQRVSA